MGDGLVVYFDGTSSRRRLVTLAFKDRLEVDEDQNTLAVWSYADIRRVDGPPGTLRLSCLTEPALARLEVRDATLAAELVPRCAQLDETIFPGGRASARSSAGRLSRWLRSSQSSCMACRSRPIVLRPWCRNRLSYNSGSLPKHSSRRCSTERYARKPQGRRRS